MAVMLALVTSSKPWWSEINPAWVIAACALIFTVGSFWWLNARQGRLRSYKPHTFASAAGGAAILFLRLPLVFYNSGPKPIVVQNLRLTFPNEPDAISGLPWRTTRTQLKPEQGDVADMPAVFAVQGRSVLQLFIEFGGPFPGIVLEPREYVVRVEAKLGHKRRSWVEVLTFSLRAQNISHPDAYIAHSNEPRELSPGELEKLKAAGDRLREQLERVSGGSNS